MQISIDSAKRMFDVDVGSEIRRIKKDMDVKNNKYPAFWRVIHSDFDQNKINEDLRCPMNYLYDLKLPQFKPLLSTLPMEHFFIKHKLELDKRICKRVEKLLCDYSLQVYCDRVVNDGDNILLRHDFEYIISELSKTSLSKNYKGLMSWLIDRAFVVTPDVKYKESELNTRIGKNRSLLIQVLYSVNQACFLSCFSKENKTL